MRPSLRTLVAIGASGALVAFWWLGSPSQSDHTANAVSEAQRVADRNTRNRAFADSILKTATPDQVAGFSNVNITITLASGDSTLSPAIWAAMRRESAARAKARAIVARSDALTRLKVQVEALTFSDGSHCPKVSSKQISALYDAHSAWSEEVLAKAACHAIWIGQNAEQLRASWGNPNDINRTVSAYGTSEQWVYGYGRYAYLDDGVVRSWQD